MYETSSLSELLIIYYFVSKIVYNNNSYYNYKNTKINKERIINDLKNLNKITSIEGKKNIL